MVIRFHRHTLPIRCKVPPPNGWSNPIRLGEMERRQNSVVTLSPTISPPAHAASAGKHSQELQHLRSLLYAEIASAPSPATLWYSAKPPPNHVPIRQGAAILRNGACLVGIEIRCGFNSLFSACCPSALTCKGEDPLKCCVPQTNCGSERFCANSSWTLFEHEGYFCCDSDAAGFNVSNYRACLNLGTLVSGAIPLPTITVDPSEQSQKMIRTEETNVRL